MYYALLQTIQFMAETFEAELSAQEKKWKATVEDTLRLAKESDSAEYSYELYHEADLMEERILSTLRWAKESIEEGETFWVTSPDPQPVFAPYVWRWRTPFPGEEPKRLDFHTKLIRHYMYGEALNS